MPIGMVGLETSHMLDLELGATVVFRRPYAVDAGHQLAFSEESIYPADLFRLSSRETRDQV